MTLRVVVTDLETGDTDERLVAAGDYALICHDPCYLAVRQSYPESGTQVLTVRGRTATEEATDG